MDLDKFRQAYKEYRNTNKGMVEWIIGLTIAEISLIISQKLFLLDWIFYCFIIISSFSMLLAIVIMYSIAASVDIDLHSAFLAKITNGKMPKQDFEAHFDKRLGKITKFMIKFVVMKKGYRLLFIPFFLNTLLASVLIFINIQKFLTTQSI